MSQGGVVFCDRVRWNRREVGRGAVDRYSTALVQITGLAWVVGRNRVPTFHLSFGLETVNIGKGERVG